MNIDLSKKKKSYIKKIKKDNTPTSDDDTEISTNNIKLPKLSDDVDSLYYESDSDYYDVPPNTPFANVTHYL